MSQESYQKKLQRITTDPSFIDTLCRHISNGGSYLDFAENLGLIFSDLATWINANDERKKKLDDAERMRVEWARQRVVDEVRDIALADLRQIYNDDGTIKEPHLWPQGIARALWGMEVEEQIGKEGKRMGWNKKVKLLDKLKALEMMGRELGLFIPRQKIEIEPTLEELVVGSRAAPTVE